MLQNLFASRENKILDAIRKRHSPGKNLSLSRTIPNFMNGELVVIDVTANNVNLEPSYVYINHEGKFTTFLSTDELSLWMSFNLKNSSFINFYFISGSIAFAITITICLMALLQQRPPDILGHALTTILGFYFGSQISQNRNARTEQQAVQPLFTQPGLQVNDTPHQ